MDKKDKLGLEIVSIMEEEVQDIYLSEDIITRILEEKKKSIGHRIKDFLNKEVELALAPIIIGFSIFLIAISLPKDVFRNQKIKTIDTSRGQIIIIGKEVDRP